MKRTAIALAIALVISGFGCVIRTEHKIDAHITLDIRHVEEEVGGVFDYVEGSSEELPGISAEEQASGDSVSWLRRVGDALSPMQVAYAKEKTSPLVKQIAERMRGRHKEVAKWKTAGCLGENNRGYVELRDCDASKEAEKKNLVQKLLTEENKDRKALYKELARIRKLDVSTLERVGANDKLKRAKAGEWVQLPAAGKYFDEFKKDGAAKKLGDACKPEAWVKMP